MTGRGWIVWRPKDLQGAETHVTVASTCNTHHALAAFVSSVSRDGARSHVADDRTRTVFSCLRRVGLSRRPLAICSACQHALWVGKPLRSGGPKRKIDVDKSGTTVPVPDSGLPTALQPIEIGPSDLVTEPR
ncbi:hypothetical protein FH972_022030 [Carpinus fangiana]|uniref:Uncharacterized protein n=1 Tax=Carpinus fangiana TaxID=176857 RepID=A0A5N6KRP5_9ROSI|nr:hypothetical protein FH972_022030 [Carpinus fangiana]